MREIVTVDDSRVELAHRIDGMSMEDMRSMAIEYPEIVDRAEAALRAVEAAMVADTPREEIERLVRSAELAWPTARLSEAESKARAKLYAEMLRTYPIDIIRRATRELVAENKFFPSISEYMAACRRQQDGLIRARNALRAFLLAAGRPVSRRADV